MEDRILNQVERWNAHQEETLRQQAHEIEEFVSDFSCFDSSMSKLLVFLFFAPQVKQS